MFENVNDVLTVKQVASILALSEAKIYELIHNGSLKSRRIGRIYRIRKTDVLEFLDS